MTKKTLNVARVATSTALGLALAVGGTSVAFAHGAKDHASSNGNGHAIEGTISGLTVSTPGSLTLTLRDGTSVTYTTTAATTYSEGHSTVASSVLSLGENVDVMLNATTPTNVDSVRIDLAKFEGKITAITGVAGAATITMSGPNNTTRTVTVDAATTFEMKGQTATFASLVVGAEIGATGLSSSNNTLTALSIRVSAPEVKANHALRVEGTISGLTVSTPGSLTLTLRDGTSVTYTTTAATTYSEGHSTVASSVLSLGENVDVMLNATTPTNVDSVRIDLAKFEGKITAITGVAGAATITMSGPNNTTRTVTVDAATTFEMKGQTATFASLVVGAEIGATGLSSSNNTLTALSIRVSAPEGSKSFGWKHQHDSSNAQGLSVRMSAPEGSMNAGSMRHNDSFSGQGFSNHDAGRH